MAPQKSPAFQFYAKDFLTGTASMSLQEVGAYIRLLCYQWDVGSVPSEPSERARLLGCAKAQERDLWKKVGKKFVLKNDAYFNERLEIERQKQTEYRRRQSDSGRASAAAKANQRSNGGSTSVTTVVEASPQPDGNECSNQNSTLQSSSSSSGKDQNTHNAPDRVNGHGKGANTAGSLPRDHRFHGHCSAKWRLCLSEATSAKFITTWGGDVDEASQAVQEFIDGLERTIGVGPKGDHLWLVQHFEAFMADKGRTPIPAPPKPKATVNGSVAAAIDKWGTE